MKIAPSNISDFAVLRFLEEAEGICIADVRKDMARLIGVRAAVDGFDSVTVCGLVFHISEGTVVGFNRKPDGTK